MVDALRQLRDDEERLSALIAKQIMDLIPGGLRRMVTNEEALAAIDNRIAEHTNGGVKVGNCQLAFPG